MTAVKKRKQAADSARYQQKKQQKLAASGQENVFAASNLQTAQYPCSTAPQMFVSADVLSFSHLLQQPLDDLAGDAFDFLPPIDGHALPDGPALATPLLVNTAIDTSSSAAPGA